MLIFLAALQDVPRALYDAAKVDGAGAWQSLLHVTIPMTTPAFLFTGLTGLINAFQYFTFAWLLTEGGPNSSTEFYAVYLYRNAFTYFKMGYASAQAWILFVLVIVITVLLFRSSARWVYYGGNVAE
jgi:multiple sugar transport system permease protein